MSGRCYVCLTPVNGGPGFDIRNPLCERHLSARAHVIRMFSGGARCQCGWSTDIPYRQPIARDEACRAHWLDVTEASS